MRILGLGDNFIDKFVDRRVYYPGGNAVNVAVFARRLGAEAAYLGVFGDDDLADHLKATLTEVGVSYDRCVTRHGETGWAEVEVIDGDRTFLGWNEGGVTLAEPYVLDEETADWAAERFDVVHSGVYAGTADELVKLAGRGPLLTFDFSEEAEWRTDDYLDRLCPHLDLALFSGAEGDDEALVAALRRAVARGTRLALGTLGSQGSLLWDGERLVRQPASDPGGPAVDTMGCGDSFVAAFLVRAHAAGWSHDSLPAPGDLDKALLAASEFAALQTRTEGAFRHGRSF
jgi:sugar/nucleoside kinase (ribokinase family)